MLVLRLAKKKGHSDDDGDDVMMDVQGMEGRPSDPKQGEREKPRVWST